MLGGCLVCPGSWASEGRAGWVRGEERGWGHGERLLIGGLLGHF